MGKLRNCKASCLLLWGSPVVCSPEVLIKTLECCSSKCNTKSGSSAATHSASLHQFFTTASSLHCSPADVATPSCVFDVVSICFQTNMKMFWAPQLCVCGPYLLFLKRLWVSTWWTSLSDRQQTHRRNRPLSALGSGLQFLLQLLFYHFSKWSLSVERCWKSSSDAQPPLNTLLQ